MARVAKHNEKARAEIEARVWRLARIEHLDGRTITQRTGVSRDSARRMIESVDRKIALHGEAWCAMFRMGKKINEVAELWDAPRDLIERAIARGGPS